MLNFEEVKKIRLVEVVGRYGVGLKYRGEYANGICPLPTHRAGDKGRNFTINLAQNYWRCFSASCNEKNEGRKGGDVINFVALMENCRERDAAQKLADWYGVDEPVTTSKNGTGQKSPTKKAEHIARPPQEGKTTPHETLPDNNKSAIEGKSGYMHDIGIQMEALLSVIADEVIRKQVKKEVMKAIYESYKNGKTART